jgi:hypothetical protein
MPCGAAAIRSSAATSATRAMSAGRIVVLMTLNEYLVGRAPAGAVADDILATFTGLLADITSEAPGTFREEALLRQALGEEHPQQQGMSLLIPAQ